MTTIHTKHNCKWRKTGELLYEHSDTIKQNTFVWCYTVIIHYYEWFWQNKAIQGYSFPEMTIRDLGIISIHMVWWPMVWPGSGSQVTWKDMVTNEHLMKCVTACLIDIRFAKCQNGMETRQFKYCLSISLLFRRIGVWNLSNLHMEWLWRPLTILLCMVAKWKAKWDG